MKLRRAKLKSWRNRTYRINSSSSKIANPRSKENLQSKSMASISVLWKWMARWRRHEMLTSVELRKVKLSGNKEVSMGFELLSGFRARKHKSFLRWIWNAFFLWEFAIKISLQFRSEWFLSRNFLVGVKRKRRFSFRHNTNSDTFMIRNHTD